MLRRTSAFALALLALLFEMTDAGATAQRTFVASYGLDSNPCSIVLPCRGFSAAIAQTSPGGEVIVLNSAGYGIVTIAKSVSIFAPTGIYAGISVFDGQTGVTVNGAGINVVLRGLSINGLTPLSVSGIHFIQGARLRVEACVVSNIGSVGIQQDAAGSEMSVVDTVVRDNAASGIATLADAHVLLDGARLERNGGDGFQVQAVSGTAVAIVRNSVSSFNGAGGIAALRPALPARTDLAVEGSVMADNAGDGLFAGGIANGHVSVTVRRSTLARNGLSGVSSFDGSGGASDGIIACYVVANEFLNNGSNAVKADGPRAFISVSGNTFASDIAHDTFSIANSGSIYTYNDNTGWAGGSGPVTSFTPF